MGFDGEFDVVRGWRKPDRNDPLAVHEVALLQLLSEGHRQHEIATMLGVGAGTVHKATEWIRSRRNFDTSERMMYEFGRVVGEKGEGVLLGDPVAAAKEALVSARAARERGVAVTTEPRIRSGRLFDNRPLREAFRNSGLSAAEVARRAGWVDGQGTAESHRVLRSLGLAAEHSGKERQRVGWEVARALADALGVSVDG